MRVDSTKDIVESKGVRRKTESEGSLTFEETEIGVPQGGPLSPLLSNIMLNELNHELENRGHRYVRYVDDLVIFCKSRKSANRTLENILPYIEWKLFLKVNRTKTIVDYVGEVKFLGFTFYKVKGITRVRVHPKSVAKMKVKIKELTSRGIQNQPYQEIYHRLGKLLKNRGHEEIDANY